MSSAQRIFQEQRAAILAALQVPLPGLSLQYQAIIDSHLPGALGSCLDHTSRIDPGVNIFSNNPLALQLTWAQETPRVDQDGKTHLGLCSKWGFILSLAGQLLPRLVL
jgi:hypothetical protein